jgi:hypothetical protein
MRSYRNSAEPVHVVDNVTAFPAERIRRLRQAECDQMPVDGADLHTVDVQHAVPVIGQIGRSRPIAMVGDDHELQTRRRRGTRHVVDRSSAIGTIRVDMNDTADGCSHSRRRGG